MSKSYDRVIRSKNVFGSKVLRSMAPWQTRIRPFKTGCDILSNKGLRLIIVNFVFVLNTFLEFLDIGTRPRPKMVEKYAEKINSFVGGTLWN